MHTFKRSKTGFLSMSADIAMKKVAKDFRSDTITIPLPEMLDAARVCALGDSVFHEDPTTEKFEKKICELTGKSSALFCTSGTLSNQIGLRTHLHQPPHSILCDHRGHVYSAEAGGLATLSQAMVTPVVPSNDLYLTLEDVKRSVILGSDIHTAPTRVISLENSLSGVIFPIEEIKRISEWARENDIKMHLDGARLWNVTAALGCSLKDVCQYFDSVSLCMSKGMCASVGSVLVGDEDFITKAEWFRKQQGGGIRQSGVLTSQCLVAIDKVWPTMPKTHQQAKRLGLELLKLGYELLVPVETNMVWIDEQTINIEKFREECIKRGLKIFRGRLVLHYWTTDEAVNEIIEAAKACVGESPTGYNDIRPQYIRK